MKELKILRILEMKNGFKKEKLIVRKKEKF